MSKNTSQGKKGYPNSVIKALEQFGFGEPRDNKFLDMRSEITGQHMFEAVSLMRVLGEYYGSTAAPIIANVLLRLSWSKGRASRKELIAAMIGANIQEPEKIVRGLEDGMGKSGE